MAIRKRRPLTDAEGNARTPTKEEWLWFARDEEFPDFDAVIAFLTEREVFLEQAEELGIDRSAFLPFDPTRPGFIDRARSALERLLERTRHAAE